MGNDITTTETVSIASVRVDSAALGIVNFVREQHGLTPLKSMGDLTHGEAWHYRQMAHAAIVGWLDVPAPRTVTHGRHCTCSACAQEDWTNPELAPCGMHGPSCPRKYVPLGAAGSLPPVIDNPDAR